MRQPGPPVQQVLGQAPAHLPGSADNDSIAVCLRAAPKIMRLCPQKVLYGIAAVSSRRPPTVPTPQQQNLWDLGEARPRLIEPQPQIVTLRANRSPDTRRRAQPTLSASSRLDAPMGARQRSVARCHRATQGCWANRCRSGNPRAHATRETRVPGRRPRRDRVAPQAARPDSPGARAERCRPPSMRATSWAWLSSKPVLRAGMTPFLERRTSFTRRLRPCHAARRSTVSSVDPSSTATISRSRNVPGNTNSMASSAVEAAEVSPSLEAQIVSLWLTR